MTHAMGLNNRRRVSANLYVCVLICACFELDIYIYVYNICNLWFILQ